jgi:predicted DNA-binding transcriptional regulator AlpA
VKRRWARQILLERAPDPEGVLPRHGLARLEQIIGDMHAEPPIPAVIPVSKSTWWAGVRSGRFPPAVKVTPGVSAWRWEDIHRLLESLRPEGGWEPPKR